MEIRLAVEKDFDVCVELLKSDEALSTPDGSFFKKEWLYAYLEDELFLVAEKDKKVVGLILGEKIKLSGALVWEFVVQKELRGQGIGKELLKKFEDECIKKSIDWIILYGANNRKTLNFYNKNGFDLGGSYIECKKELK